MPLDNHYGKYDGPLAALSEYWVLSGDWGDDSFTNEYDSSGTILWSGDWTTEPVNEDERSYLVAEYGMTTEEVNELSSELRKASGILHSWDSQGFVYATTLNPTETETARASIEATNEAWNEDDDESLLGDESGYVSLGAVLTLFFAFFAAYLVAHVGAAAARILGGAL